MSQYKATICIVLLVTLSLFSGCNSGPKAPDYGVYDPTKAALVFRNNKSTPFKIARVTLTEKSSGEKQDITGPVSFAEMMKEMYPNVNFTLPKDAQDEQKVCVIDPGKYDMVVHWRYIKSIGSKEYFAKGDLKDSFSLDAGEAAIYELNGGSVFNFEEYIFKYYPPHLERRKK